MSQVGRWKAALLSALCERDWLVPAWHFVRTLGRPLTRAESGALYRAIRALARCGDVVAAFAPTRAGGRRTVVAVVGTPEATIDGKALKDIDLKHVPERIFAMFPTGHRHIAYPVEGITSTAPPEARPREG
jgi:hypothetical protein